MLAMAPDYEDAALIKEKAVTEYNMAQLYEEGRTEFEAGISQMPSRHWRNYGLRASHSSARPSIACM